MIIMNSEKTRFKVYKNKKRYPDIEIPPKLLRIDFLAVLEHSSKWFSVHKNMCN